MADMSGAGRYLALAEMMDKIISFLDNNDQINCLRDTTRHHIALAHALRDEPDSQQPCHQLYECRLARLPRQRLAREALIRNSRYALACASNAVLHHPASLLANDPHCTNLESLL
jgi:hypothetical protein